MNEHQKILSCWHKLEFFQPAATPKLSEDEVAIIDMNAEPWKIPYKSKDPKKTIEYSIFFGVIASKIVNDFVNEFFNQKEKDENFKSAKICYASIKLSEDGKYINDSFGLSTLPWALSQLENNKITTDNWENGFTSIKDDLLDYIDSNFKETITDAKGNIIKVSRVLNNTQLAKFQDEVERKCNWSRKPQKDIYIKRIEKFRKSENKESQSSSDILNSFYTKDLEKIIRTYNEKGLPNAFRQYMDGSTNKYSKRIDLSKDVNILKQTLSINNIPDGCWPSTHQLSLMQQFAVNTIFCELKNENKSGLFSVNGPPGTGKTTLLRDIIAPIIVDRAKELSKIKNPTDAFTKVGEIKINENFSPWIHKPQESIANGGIVIASSNNGAVENISKELPLKQEVPPFYSDSIEYFKEIAENCINEENWGLVSAVLGNKENRSNLVNSLWFKDEEKKDNSSINFQDYLKGNKLFDNSSWENIKNQFNIKLNEIQIEKSKLTELRKEHDDFISTANTLNTITKVVDEIQINYNSIIENVEKSREEKRQLTQRKSEILDELKIIKESKPNFFGFIFSKAKRNSYKNALSSALDLYNEITHNLSNENTSLTQLEKKYSETKTLLDKQKKQKAEVLERFEILKIKTQNAKTELGNNYADNDFWENIESKKTQEACPWYSSKLKELNSELFIISMKLHEVFILTANASSSKISTTLSAFFDYLRGEQICSKLEVKAMWDTFFLVIPVISSTFASIQTMFRDLGQDDLPWLFIDEAGQAVPQAAAGSIWRSKRVGIVGDPFQIEPVVTISKTVTDNISTYFDLNNQQVSSELSVQSMADRINPLGTYLTINSKKEWIGIPLKIHRRCISPMFEIANAIAYDNSMYNSTVNPNEVSIGFQTSFIDCKGSVDGKHFIPEQAEIIKNLLIAEVNKVKNLPNVFVITPFSEISYKLNSFLLNPLLSEVNKFQKIKGDEMKVWLKNHIGTVHTFQGKQADGVILCLGLDEKSKGAANWASKKPNLLNVAITRAKYRFIGIGDKNIWLNQPYFNKLKNLNT